MQEEINPNSLYSFSKTTIILIYQVIFEIKYYEKNQVLNILF